MTVVEKTVILTVNWLPASGDREWVWFEDCNVVALAARLDATGRERALAEALGQYATR